MRGVWRRSAWGQGLVLRRGRAVRGRRALGGHLWLSPSIRTHGPGGGALSTALPRPRHAATASSVVHAWCRGGVQCRVQRGGGAPRPVVEGALLGALPPPPPPPFLPSPRHPTPCVPHTLDPSAQPARACCEFNYVCAAGCMCPGCLCLGGTQPCACPRGFPVEGGGGVGDAPASPVCRFCGGDTRAVHPRSGVPRCPAFLVCENLACFGWVSPLGAGC
jgi:hypothetical protein